MPDVGHPPNRAGPRLCDATLLRAAPGVVQPAYPRDGLVPGVFHFGPGAFHRAHQAVYLDEVLRRDRRWAISAASLTSPATAQALQPQDGLYTLVRLDEDQPMQVVGALVEVLTPDDRAAIAARLASPATRLVTSTVTEKGYHLTASGALDVHDPAVARDLASPDAPATLVGWLAHGLAQRRAAGSGGLTILSCDNLADNGRRLRGAVLDFARTRGGDLAGWIEDEVRFPCTMVDSITPAADSSLRDRVAARTGLLDAWPVQREAFAQWVVEDDFSPAGRPPLDLAGVQFARDVAPFETAKLRLLNGAHSALAYLGLLLGHGTVAEAMAEAPLARFIERLMREDIAPDLRAAEGLDINRYIDAVLSRFRNPAINHRLIQIAADGSQKLPFRILASTADALAAGRAIGRLALPVGAWLRHLAEARPPAPPLADPLASRLLDLAATGPLRVMQDSGVFPDRLKDAPAYVAAVLDAYEACASPHEVRRRF